MEHSKLLINFIFVIVTLLEAYNPSRRQSIRYLQCAPTHTPPFGLIRALSNGSLENVGPSRMFAEWLAVKLNFSLEFVYPTPEETKEKGNVMAAMDVVASGRADFTSSGFVVTPERQARLEFSTYHNWEDGYRMVVPRPGERDRLFAFIDPFDWKVWLLTGTSLMIVSCFMVLLTWTSAHYTSTRRDTMRNRRIRDYIGKYFLYSVNVLTNHGDYLSESKSTFLVGVGAWLLGASVLVYGYSSTVVSSITFPKQLPSLNTFEDVLAHPYISLIIRTDAYVGNAIYKSSDVPLYKALREKSLNRPESVGTEDVINSTGLLLTGKYAHTAVETATRFTVATQYVREGKCRFKLSKRLPLQNNYFYQILQKGNKNLAREISISNMQLAETGLILNWMSNIPWFPKADECFAESSRKTAKITSIKLIDLTSAFFIFGVGIAFSALICFAELVFFYRA